MGKVKLQLLTTTEDTKDNIVTFTSGDTANPTAWKDVATLASKEKHSSLLNKISTMFNNIRYLYKILGTTDISALGTVTQAISTIKGNIGDMKGISSSAAITTQGQYALDAREKNASVDGTLANEINKLNSNLQWKMISVPEPTHDGNRRIYNFNLNAYTEVEVLIIADGYKPLFTKRITTNNTLEGLCFIDIDGKKWIGTVGANDHAIEVTTYPNSDEFDSHPLVLGKIYAR